jgi:hypothetical protein
MPSRKAAEERGSAPVSRPPKIAITAKSVPNAMTMKCNAIQRVRLIPGRPLEAQTNAGATRDFYRLGAFPIDRRTARPSRATSRRFQAAPFASGESPTRAPQSNASAIHVVVLRVGMGSPQSANGEVEPAVAHALQTATRVPRESGRLPASNARCACRSGCLPDTRAGSRRFAGETTISC